MTLVALSEIESVYIFLETLHQKQKALVCFMHLEILVMVDVL